MAQNTHHTSPPKVVRFI